MVWISSSDKYDNYYHYSSRLDNDAINSLKYFWEVKEFPHSLGRYAEATLNLNIYHENQTIIRSSHRVLA